MSTIARRGVAFATVFGLALATNVLHAQTLPSSVPLSDVQIQLVTGGGDGCAVQRCTHYRLSIRGDGTVTLEDIGEPPRDNTVTHAVSKQSVVKLVNGFLTAGFVDFPSPYVSPSRMAMLKGESLLLLHLDMTLPYADITLTLGTFSKTVRVYWVVTGLTDVPPALTDLDKSIWKMARPPDSPVAK